MKLQKDDPRLLQYVLNEISDTDRKLVEAAIFNQTEISNEVKVLQKIYSNISNFESSSIDLRLSQDRKDQLFAATIDKKSSRLWTMVFNNWRLTAGGLIAASFAVMVFNSSLKNEVYKSPEVSLSRPTIPADSDSLLGSATGSGPRSAADPVARSKSEDKEAFTEKNNLITPPESNEKLAADEESLSEKTQSFGEAAPAEMKDEKSLDSQDVPAPPQAPALAASIQDVAQSDGSEFRLRKEIDATPTGAPDIAEAEGSAGSKEGPQVVQKQMVAGAFKKSASPLPEMAKMQTFAAQSSGVRDSSAKPDSTAGQNSTIYSDKSMFNQPAKKLSGKLQVQISSRALEAEQIQTMTKVFEQCLKKNPVERELKIEYQPHENKYRISNANPTSVEKSFADCGFKAFVQLISPYIKIVFVELKDSSK